MKKKFLCLILSVLMIAAVLPGVSLFAEQDVPFTLTVTTSDGTDPVLSSYNGYTLEMDFMIASLGSNFGSDIVFDKITWSNGSSDLNHSVSASDNKLTIFNKKIAFGEMDGGKTVVFKLYWHTDEKPSPEPLSVDFKPIEAKPSMTVRAVVEQTNVVPGSEITILYEAQNNGNVPVQYVTIYDDEVTALLRVPCIAMMDRSDDLLLPGETFSESVTLRLDSTLKIKPRITYLYEKRLEETGEETQITVNEVMPSVSLTCENYSVANKGDRLRFHYTIHNTSTVRLTEIHVYDADSQTAQLVSTPFSLDPGAKYEGTFEAVISRSGFYKFKIDYAYEGSDGFMEISAKTERSIRIPSEVSFRITGISPNTILEAGDMVFSLTVENAGSTELTDLSISEENGLMTPVSLNVIIPGSINEKNGELTRSVTVHIPASGTKLKFNLSYRIDGEYASINTVYTVDFDTPLQTPTVDDATPSPVGTEPDDETPLLLWISICLLILLLIAGAVTLLILLRRRSSPDENRPVRRRIDESFDETNEADYLYNDPEEDYEEVYEAVDQQPLDETDPDTDEDGVRIYRGNDTNN